MFKRKRLKALRRRRKRAALHRWARAGMPLTFRAEVMPGRESTERTFTVAKVLGSGRVELVDMVGEHTETEFERAR